MVNKEAIEVIRKNWPSSNYTQLIEALNIAINSLSDTDNNVYIKLLGLFDTRILRIEQTCQEILSKLPHKHNGDLGPG
jgi:hypothetical protein